MKTREEILTEIESQIEFFKNQAKETENKELKDSLTGAILFGVTLLMWESDKFGGN